MGRQVTVVIPVYNVEKYLEECVRSITGQTYQNLEILLIDDGSTDSSGAICDQLAESDGRIRVIHKKNGGVASARNLGIDEAKGEYIMFIDADDWIDSDTIASVVSYAEKHQVDVVKFNYVREFDDKQLVKRNTFLEERIYVGNECLTICRQVLGLEGKELAHPENMNFLAPCWGNLYKRNILCRNNVRFTNIWEVGSFEDGLFNFCAFLRMKKFAYVDKAYYHYRKYNASSETSGYRQDYVSKRLNLARMLKEIIEKENQWDYFDEAYNNRMVLTTMEIAFNAMANKAGFFAKYNEIDGVLHHSVFREAYKAFNLKHLDLKWKMYFFFIKHSMTLPSFLITAIIMELKSKGVR